MRVYPEQVLTRIRLHIKKEWIICFLAAMAFGLLAHVYKLTNFLPNWDSLLNFHTNQDKTNLGRCFLTYACALSSYYDLPWINGLLSLTYIAGSAVCISELFHMKGKIPLVLIGGLMATFPTVTSTLAYSYTADGYFLALLFVCLAVILVVRCRKGILSAAVLIAFVLGVYQAYVTFALVLMLIYLIDRLLFFKMSFKEFWISVGKFAAAVLLGGIGYWISLKVILLVSNTGLSEYQNISKAFSLQDIQIFKSILRCGYKFLTYFFQFREGINLFLILNMILVLLLTVLFLFAFRVQKTAKEIWRLGLILLCMAAIPFASYALYFINPILDYHNLMVMCLCLIYILPVLFYERLLGVIDIISQVKQWSILLVSILTICNFIILSNISYQKMHMAYEKSYGIIVRLADRIEQIPQARDCKKIAVIGYLPGSEDISVDFPPDMTGITDSYIIRKQDTMMQENVTQAMLRDYCGISYEDTTKEDIEKIYQKKKVSQMNCWPEKNSLTVVDDILVVKFGGQIDE